MHYTAALSSLVDLVWLQCYVDVDATIPGHHLFGVWMGCPWYPPPWQTLLPMCCWVGAAVVGLLPCDPVPWKAVCHCPVLPLLHHLIGCIVLTSDPTGKEAPGCFGGRQAAVTMHIGIAFCFILLTTAKMHGAHNVAALSKLHAASDLTETLVCKLTGLVSPSTQESIHE